MNYNDPSGEYGETVIDLIFLSLSARDFYLNPGLTTGFFVTLDAIGTALPIPALAGYIKNGARALKILRYFDSVAEKTGKKAYEIALTFAEHALFKQERRAWSKGKAGDSLASLVGHYEDHGAQLGANSLEEYYKKANDFIDNFVEDADNIIEKQTRTDGTIDTVYQNTATGEKAVVSEGGTVRSYYKED